MSLDNAGWKPIAKVDSRSDAVPGCQHADLISDTSGTVGQSSSESWKRLTGKIEMELADAWRKQ